MTATASGSSSAAVLNPVNPSIATTSTASRQALSRAASHDLNACLERPSTTSSKREDPVPFLMGVRLMITVGYLSPRRVCRHACSSTPTAVTPSKRCSSSSSARLPSARTASFAVFHATPRLADPRYRQVLAHDPLKGPPQPEARQSRPRFGRLAGVLTPHVSTPCAPVPADCHLQHRRPPAHRLVCQSPHHGVARLALTPHR